VDNYIISNVAELREVIGDEIPELGEKNIDHLDEFSTAFIKECPFIVLSTSDKNGRVDASPKGDAPGFVHIVDDKTIVIPDRPGNKLAYGHLNIIENPRVGLLMTIPGTNETLRINGKAELSREPELLESLAARGKAAVIAIKIHIEECFFHCGKATIRSKLWNSNEWPAKHKVSFGEMYAKKKNLGDDVSKRIDESIHVDYRDNL